MDNNTPLSGKKIVMITASNRFRDEEYFEPKKILSDAGATIITASSSLNVSTGVKGGKVKPDILITSVNVDDYDAVIFIGGGGAEEYWDNQTAHAIARQTVEMNKVLAAICIAPVILAKAGVLKGKKATVFPDEQPTIKKEGAICTGKTIEIDGNIVTVNGPQSANAFGKAIKNLLLKQ